MTHELYKEVTLKEVLDALKTESGLVPMKFNYYDSKSDLPREGEMVHCACALGNAAVNLGCTPYSLYDALNFEEQEYAEDRFPILGDKVCDLNDNQAKAWPEIAETIEGILIADGVLFDTKIEVRKAIWEKVDDSHYVYKNYVGEE